MTSRANWGRRGAGLCAGVLILCVPVLGASGPRDSLQEAARLFELGRLEKAECEARTALSDPETKPVAYSILGAIRLQQKRYQESAQFLQQALQLNSGLLGAQLNLGQVYTLLGKQQAAASVFRRVLELDPSSAKARLALAKWEAEQGHYQRSLEVAQPVLATLRESPEGLYLLTIDYLKTGGRTSAAALVADWKRTREAPPAWSVKSALLLAGEGLASEAAEVLEHVKQSGPLSYEVAFNLGGAYLMKGELARALENYDAALTLKPEAVPALRQAAEIAERQGELERALSYWLRAKKLQPDDPDVLYGFGRVCLRMDLLEDAEPALTRAAALRPGQAAFQYALASARVGKRQFEAAQELLQTLVKKTPRDPRLQYALGAVLYLQGRLDEAAERLRESVRLEPVQLASRYYLGLIARDQGKEEEAIQTFEELLRQHPEHAASYEALGALLVSRRRYPEAESRLEKAVSLNPKSVKANYQLGLLLTRMGKQEEANKRLEFAKSLRQEDEATSRLQLRLLEPDR